VGRRTGREKQAKLVGWDKDSLTEQQRKRTVTTMIPIRTIEKKAKRIHRAPVSPLGAQRALQQ